MKSIIIFAISLGARLTLGSVCIPARAFENDQVLRESLQQACVTEWVKDKVSFTKKMIDTTGFALPIQAHLNNLAPSNPNPPLSIGLESLDLSGGALKLKVPGEKDVMLIDASTLMPGTTIAELKLSPNGEKLLYSTVTSGSDVANWSFYDLKNRRILKDSPISIRFIGLQWDSSSQGVYYTQWPSQRTEEEWIKKDSPRLIPIFYHKIGTSASADRLVFTNPEKRPSMLYGVVETGINDQLVAYRNWPGLASQSLYWGTKTGDHYNWRRIKSAGDKPLVRSRFLGKIESEIYFLSSENGDHYSVVAYNLKQALRSRIVIEQSKNKVLYNAQVIGNRIYAQYFDDEFHISMDIVDSHGKVLNDFFPINFGWPARGTLSIVKGTDLSDHVTFTYAAMDFYPTTLSYDLRKGEFKVLPNSHPDPDILKRVESELRFYSGLDGRPIPMQVFRLKGSTNKPLFALEYYYGAITIPTLSNYNPRFLTLLEMGGIVAIASIRGGGEKGEQWYRDGATNKKLTIGDIAAGSRFLKSNYQIQGDRVIAEGGSWGGAHTNMALVNYAQDFTAFVAQVPLGNVTYAFNSVFGWLLPDDILFSRSIDGNYSRYERDLMEVKKWSPFQNVARMTVTKPILTIGTSNDERTGTEQPYLMPLALENRFGPGAESYLTIVEGGGHSGRSETAEIAFIAKYGGVKDFK